MTQKEIDDVIVTILIQDGPDGHCDGHEIITEFIQALVAGRGEQWYREYLERKS